MAKTRARLAARLTVERLEGRDLPASPWLLQTFDQMSAGALPSGWLLHNSGGPVTFAASAARPLGADLGFRADGGSAAEARVWSPMVLPADAQVSGDIFLDSLVPAQIIARGRNLESDKPSY